MANAWTEAQTPDTLRTNVTAYIHRHLSTADGRNLQSATFTAAHDFIIRIAETLMRMTAEDSVIRQFNTDSVTALFQAVASRQATMQLRAKVTGLGLANRAMAALITAHTLYMRDAIDMVMATDQLTDAREDGVKIAEKVLAMHQVEQQTDINPWTNATTSRERRARTILDNAGFAQENNTALDIRDDKTLRTFMDKLDALKGDITDMDEMETLILNIASQWTDDETKESTAEPDTKPHGPASGTRASTAKGSAPSVTPKPDPLDGHERHHRLLMRTAECLDIQRNNIATTARIIAELAQTPSVTSDQTADSLRRRSKQPAPSSTSTSATTAGANTTAIARPLYLPINDTLKYFALLMDRQERAAKSIADQSVRGITPADDSDLEEESPFTPTTDPAKGRQGRKARDDKTRERKGGMPPSMLKAPCPHRHIFVSCQGSTFGNCQVSSLSTNRQMCFNCLDSIADGSFQKHRHACQARIVIRDKPDTYPLLEPDHMSPTQIANAKAITGLSLTPRMTALMSKTSPLTQAKSSKPVQVPSPAPPQPTRPPTPPATIAAVAEVDRFASLEGRMEAMAFKMQAQMAEQMEAHMAALIKFNRATLPPPAMTTPSQNLNAIARADAANDRAAKLLQLLEQVDAPAAAGIEALLYEAERADKS